MFHRKPCRKLTRRERLALVRAVIGGVVSGVARVLVTHIIDWHS